MTRIKAAFFSAIVESSEIGASVYSTAIVCEDGLCIGAYLAVGDFIDAIHKKWWNDFDQLEYHHGFIQW